VFDYMLSLDIPWDFVQIQMNYADWRHAQGRNVNAVIGNFVSSKIGKVKST